MENELRALLRAHGQEHVMQWYDELTEDEKRSLENEIHLLDFSMIDQAMNTHAEDKKDVIEPLYTLPVSKIKEREEEFSKIGRKELEKGALAAVILAGGQGTRLGFDGPKGTLNVGITKELYLFECLIRNMQKNLEGIDKPMPLYIMTSDQNHEQTVAFFEEHDCFGYPKEAVHFFKQAMAPALSFEGKILMQDKGHLCQAPNGNGGWFQSMEQQGLIDEMMENGVRWLNVVSVDNVLQNIGDPVFLGATIDANCYTGAKVIAKVSPDERVGAICLRNKRPSVVEYSELSDEMRLAKDDKGNYLYHYGVTLNYLFEIHETRRCAKNHLPIHKAIKKMRYMDDKGQIVEPAAPNAYKLETFIFDILEFFDDVLSFEVVREDEFAPIKNATGVDSLDTARKLLVDKTGMEL